MGESAKKEKRSMKAWFEGLKAEFTKIIWPDKKSLGKQTLTVVIITIIVGIIIAIVDFFIQYGVNFLINI